MIENLFDVEDLTFLSDISSESLLEALEIR